MLSAPVSFDKNRILRSFSTSILSPRACTSSRPTRMKILRTLLNVVARLFAVFQSRHALRGELLADRGYPRPVMKVVFCRFGAKKSRDAWSVSRIIAVVVLSSKVTHRAREQRNKTGMHINRGVDVVNSLSNIKKRRYFSHLWPQIPPINLVFGGSFSHREPRSLRSSPRRQKRTTPHQRTPRQRRRARRLRLGAFFFVGHRDPPAAFDFFLRVFVVSTVVWRTIFLLPSSSTKAARTKRRPRRPPQKEPGSGRDAISIVVVVVVVVSL